MWFVRILHRTPPRKPSHCPIGICPSADEGRIGSRLGTVDDKRRRSRQRLEAGAHRPVGVRVVGPGDATAQGESAKLTDSNFQILADDLTCSWTGLTERRSANRWTFRDASTWPLFDRTADSSRLSASLGIGRSLRRGVSLFLAIAL